MIICDVCKFDMDIGEHPCIGMRVTINPIAQKYSPRHDARVYNVCYSCLLEGVGVKPNITKVEVA